ncbi:MAG: thioredoxin [Candidatus Dormibacteraeota bacterium]|nr:thioredoxin [Candidatus Dormibacteraeota bacterium]MBO0743814.1 thioredoxin [Candidatus Dormibacteraeota bacterium]
MSTAVAALNDADFEETIHAADRPVLVEFWAPWCAPCRMLSPVVRDLAEEFGDQVQIRQLNVDDNPETQSRLKVMSMPTVLIFKDGNPVERQVGYRSGIKDLLRQRLRALL